MAQILRILPEDHTVSEWSGGKTRQIYIHPPGARYADRDFIFRVSSATVELDESDFTPLPDYRRYLSVLEGNVTLLIGENKPLVLGPHEIATFDGADRTRSQGRCTDFNLMLRKGACGGRLRALHLARKASEPLPESGMMIIYCAQGAVKLTGRNADQYCTQGEALAVKEREEGLSLEALKDAALLIAEIDIT